MDIIRQVSRQKPPHKRLPSQTVSDFKHGTLDELAGCFALYMDKNMYESDIDIDKEEYLLDKEDLAVLQQETGEKGVYGKLSELGGVSGLAVALKTNIRNGLTTKEINSDFMERKERFGLNTTPEAVLKTWLELALEQLKEPMIIVLMIGGLISFVSSTIDDPERGWIEGVAIWSAVAIVTIVSATNDWKKERQFQEIAQKEESKCMVVRAGQTYTIHSEEVVVGDLVLLKSGDAIPADGILITSTGLQVKTAALTGESDSVKKDFENPFLQAGTEVIDGEATMLVIAVGEETQRGKISATFGARRERTKTPLEDKLDKLAGLIGYGGSAIAILIFLVLSVSWLIDLLANDKSFEVSENRQGLITAFVFAVTIVVVAIPEGLPLAVTISLAYSMKKMVADNNFVRVLSACETMGNATDICSDKTGTLTLNQMTVVHTYLGQKHNTGNLKISDINDGLRKTIVEGESVNSKVVLVPPEQEGGKMRWDGGNPTATACLAWACTLMKEDEDYKILRAKNLLKKAYPFSSSRKFGAVLIQKENKNGYRLYLKGATEKVLGMSSKILNNNNEVEEFSSEKNEKAGEIVHLMTRTGLRTICLAYRDYTNDEVKVTDDNEIIDPLMDNLVIIGIIGIKDPLRGDVRDSVEVCHKAGIVVYMVTGDHIDTAKYIARECHILTNEKQVAITGEQFRTMTEEERESLLSNLRVIARCSPDDKLMLVKLLQTKKKVVAVTGDGTNDAPAIFQADIGLSMGIQGTDVARGASDIVILDDSFSSIVKTCMWGRSVYDNIRKFLTFQVTINVVALVISLVAAIKAAANPGSPPLLPLNAIELLWINLIMDTLAALALGTEKPTMDLLSRKPFTRTCSLISPLMWKNILGQSCMQLFILLFLLFLGEYTIWPEILDIDDTHKRHILKSTIIFNTFVFLQLSNEINCRKVNNEHNIFQNIFKNKMFLVILFICITMQFLIIQFLGDFTETVPLSPYQWLTTVAIGMISLPWGVVVRFIPINKEHGMIKIDMKKEFEIDEKFLVKTFER